MAEHPITMDGDVPSAGELARLISENGARVLPPVDDRESWGAILARPWVAQTVDRAVCEAEELVGRPVPPVRPTDYLSFFEDGVRDPYDRSAGARTGALACLMVAECAEGGGRFLRALLDTSWALAEETSWVMPPHLRWGQGQALPDVEEPTIDLRVAFVGQMLAELCAVFGVRMDALSPLWRKRIGWEMARQVVRPFLGRSHGWEDARHNWNAVCNSGVTATAVLGGWDAGVCGAVVSKALGSVRDFLKGFTADGGCSEGPSYWQYGMSRFASLAYLVDVATGGSVDVLADPVVGRAMRYAAGMVLTRPRVVNFSDCPARIEHASGPVAWAAGRLGEPGAAALASGLGRVRPRRFSLVDLCLAAEPHDLTLPARTFLPDLQVLVARGKGAEGEQIVLAAKGGHNGEHHNHNDVGAFIVHWRGESLICDLGKGKYVREMFGAGRYDLLCTRSRGHNVPLVNGVEQGTGAEFRAEGFAAEEGDGSVGVVMELAGTYHRAAGLESLRRRLRLVEAGSERVELEDDVTFARGAGEYELPLYTEGEFAAVEQGVAEARGANAALRVHYDADVVEAEVAMVDPEDDELRERFGGYVSKLTLRLARSVERAAVRVVFEPVV
jgi:hypothetical protein